MPSIKNKEFEPWARHIKLLADCQNLYCKISGMVTEADWENWNSEDFFPYLDLVFESFGTKRVLLGSD